MIEFDHKFPLFKGHWLGNGSVDLSMTKEKLKFSMRWNIQQLTKDQLEASQEIAIHGMSDPVKNKFYFYNITPNHFTIRLESPDLGEVIGQGIIRKKIIAWEFKQADPFFEGYEVYTLLDDGAYDLVAEYATLENYRSKITGQIWKKLDIL